MRRAGQFIHKNRYIIALFIFFFILRLLHITLLPIFNDEAIYLDWGWRETHIPGNLFYSLFDSKQPLEMWLFGFALQIFSDPLFGGRFVSILFGAITLLGLYKIGKEYFDKFVGYLAGFIYTIIPLFSFFDRQALMESAIGAMGIWSLYVTSKCIRDENKRYKYYLGIVWGIGFFIKTTMSLFILTSIILLVIIGIKQKKSLKVISINLLLSCMTMIGIDGLLFIQPQFWSTFSSNNRYSLTVNEILSFPVMHVMQNIWINMVIMFVTITPIIFIGGIIGVILLLKTNKQENKIIVWWFVISFLLQTLFVRNNLSRYIVSFLPVFVLFIAYTCSHLKNRYYKLFFPISIIGCIPAISLTLIQIFSPLSYFMFTSSVMNYSERGGYVTGWTAGYGIDQVMSYLNNVSRKSPIYVGMAMNTGNPESAIRVYFAKNEQIKTIYFDSRQFQGDVSAYDCIGLDKDLYFVSRDEQQAGLNKFFTKVFQVNNPYGENRIGVYRLKQPCKGNTIQLDLSSNVN